MQNIVRQEDSKLGFLKELGTFVGAVAGEVIGGAVEFVGEVTDSDFIKDVGKGVCQVTSKTGEFIGSVASGTYDTIGGIITGDSNQLDQGMGEVFDSVGNTISGIGNGIANVAEKGFDTVGAIIDGDTDKALVIGKDIAKVAVIGVLSFGIIDIVDGFDSADGVDVTTVENPDMHHVTPHFRTLADGSEIFVDGDGDTSVDTNVGWMQHNPAIKQG